MEGRTHKLAFALFASINIHLHRFDDSVIFGEVFVLGHAATIGTESAGRQQPIAAKVGRQYGPGSEGGSSTACPTGPRGWTVRFGTIMS